MVAPPQNSKNNHMKKYITFDRIAYTMSLSTFIFIAVTLCAACVDLQKRTAPHNFTPEQINILDELEKPLVFDGMFLDDSNS
jgi:hypothetical protein